jgi:hypothetical protein
MMNKNKNDRQAGSGGSSAQRDQTQRDQTQRNQNEQRGRGGQGQGQSYTDQAEGYLERGNEQLRGMVEDHEGQTVLVALALGFGIGVAIGYAMAGPSEHESARWIDRSTAEGLGRRLMERIDQMLPEAITSRMHG